MRFRLAGWLMFAFIVAFTVTDPTGFFRNVSVAETISGQVLPRGMKTPPSQPVTQGESSHVTKSSLVEWVPNNVYLFTPAHFGEVGEEEQLNFVLRDLSKKYHILGVQIQGRYYTSSLNAPNIMVSARIFVGARQF